jgi:hypothetical protein
MLTGLDASIAFIIALPTCESCSVDAPIAPQTLDYPPHIMVVRARRFREILHRMLISCFLETCGDA